MGIHAYPNLKSLPERVDLAVIATPAATVPDLIGECVETGVRGVIIISAGFREAGAAGAELERRILEQSGPAKLRIIGPNCLGVMNPLTGLNATFAGAIARPGNVAFLSQSGALCTAILDWSLREQVGFSAFVSIGSMLDVSWGDLIDHLGDDPHTHSILMYMESIGDARRFLSAAREVALTKPIIVIKPGRTAAAAKAAASHTGAMAGSDDVLDSAFRRAGVLRVDTVDELFGMASLLAKQPRPANKRLTILTNAGGPGVIATDELLIGGGSLAPVPENIKRDFDAFLPMHWSRGNPIDVLGDADPERYAKAVEIAAKNPESDGLLVILTPQDMTDPTATAERLRPYAKSGGKPVLACWMGGASVLAGIDILHRAEIPSFSFPDAAVRAFNYMWRYAEALRLLYESPSLEDPESGAAVNRQAATATIENARRAGRTLLTEAESKALLAAYGVPTVPTYVATTAEEAVQRADAIGYPVAVKLHSFTITHKTDVGGVRLNLPDATAVRAAFDAMQSALCDRGGFDGVTVQPMIKVDGYELILGCSPDPQFGPVLLFGSGGQLVEVFRDRSLALPPLTAPLARRLMERTKIYTALCGVRGRKSVDMPALERLLVRFSQMIVEQPLILECDVNPLLASEDGLLALDARVVLHDPSAASEALPKSAIRPYPVHLVSPWKLKSGAGCLIRPIRPEDEGLLVRFHETLSERSVQLRYFHPMKYSRRVAHERLIRVCFLDYDREIALVCEITDASGRKEIVGVGRLSKLREWNAGEFALVVADHWQGQGLGTELLRRLIAFAREEGLGAIVADVLPENSEMQTICRRLGFDVRQNIGDPAVRVEMRLT
jgi:acetyltransferase